jgi:hypothetical protein
MIPRSVPRYYPMTKASQRTLSTLKASMELLPDRDPEDARKLLDPVLEHMMEAVHRYEGPVNEAMGAGMMASSARRWPTRITPCGRAMRRSGCRRRSCATRTTRGARTAWSRRRDGCLLSQSANARSA